jgi:hypothetical protein
MRLRPPVCFLAILVVLLGTIAWADQIVLKDGTVYSGKFVRGDSNSVDFQILGKIESFRIVDIAQIVFKEPGLNSSNARVTKTPAPPTPAPKQDAQISNGEPTPVQIRRAPQVPPRETPAVDAGSGSSGSDRGYAKGPESGRVLPAGTPVVIRTSTVIDTDRNRVGDVFDASLEQPLIWGNDTVFPRGTTAKGRIAYAKEQGKLSGQAQLVLELTELTANGRSYLLRTSDYTEAGANRANRTAATVGGTAALGAIIGAIAGGGTGAAVGAASGAAVGTGVQVMTHGQVLRIPAETILEFKLQSPLNLDAP